MRRRTRRGHLGVDVVCERDEIMRDAQVVFVEDMRKCQEAVIDMEERRRRMKGEVEELYVEEGDIVEMGRAARCRGQLEAESGEMPRSFLD